MRQRTSKFKCTKCGLCCQLPPKIVRSLPKLKRAPRMKRALKKRLRRRIFTNMAGHHQFAFKPVGALIIFASQNFSPRTGRCRYLARNNTCRIYSRRPLICKIDGYWKQYLSDVMPLKKWHSFMYVLCHKLQVGRKRDEGIRRARRRYRIMHPRRIPMISR